jgi:hypothetical protein
LGSAAIYEIEALNWKSLVLQLNGSSSVARSKCNAHSALQSALPKKLKAALSVLRTVFS